VSEPHYITYNWMCLKRGVPANGPSVIHFCHLCMYRIRSNYMFLRNQLHCLSCQYTTNRKCTYQPVLNGWCIREAKLELARLTRCPVAQQVVSACVDGDYYRFYKECKVHLVRSGRQAGIDDDIVVVGGAPINQYEYEQLLLETLDKLGVLISVHDMLVPEQNHLARVMLKCIAHIV
jgi:hypothetical protein